MSPQTKESRPHVDWGSGQRLKRIDESAAMKEEATFVIPATESTGKGVLGDTADCRTETKRRSTYLSEDANNNQVQARTT